ncbi:uspA domain-containing protein [Caldimicrobium thiodismutans]|uniref:UspA domain-containing protein n=1 Tax=Caldimicrobium thiodismutans TaxID=1653476 RepID=A0A0U5AMK1_9BACT|nr:universal stress protein [Caldimicrobium thiodismutans]BAU23268.1 uspA domain-containing protein [Caldimicrobium thiodismutans]
MLYKKIMACLDGSEESFNAYRNAIRIAKELSAELLAINVVPLKTEISSALSLFLGMKDIFIKGGEKILKEAEEIAGEENFKVKLILDEGEPFQRIVDTALAEEVDLLVMGKTGKTGLAKGILGSTAMRTIGASPVDVLIIPKEKTLQFKKLLVPTDGSSYAEKATLRALEIAKTFKSEVFLLSVVEIPFELYEAPGEIAKLTETLKTSADELIRREKIKFKSEGLSVQGLIMEGVPEERILETASKEDIDLIIMGSHGKTGLKRLLMGSVTEMVINTGDKPVLVVKS